MASALRKSQVPQELADLTLTEEQKQIIDKYAELDRQIQVFEPTAEQHKALKETIQSWAEAAPAENPVVLRTQNTQLKLSARRRERTILNKPKVFALLRKALGIDGLIALLNIPMEGVDKYIPKSAQAALIHEELSGYRTVAVVSLRPAVGVVEEAA